MRRTLNGLERVKSRTRHLDLGQTPLAEQIGEEGRVVALEIDAAHGKDARFADGGIDLVKHECQQPNHGSKTRFITHFAHMVDTFAPYFGWERLLSSCIIYYFKVTSIDCFTFLFPNDMKSICASVYISIKC